MFGPGFSPSTKQFLSSGPSHLSLKHEDSVPLGTGKKEEDKNDRKQDIETTLKTAGLRSSHAYPIGHLAIISVLLFPGDTDALRVELVCFSFFHLLHTKVTFYHPYFDPRYFP